MNGIIKLILTVVIIFITTVAYTIAVELSGHGLISSIVNTVGGMLIVYLWWNKKIKTSSPLFVATQLTPKIKFNSKKLLVFLNQKLVLIVMFCIAILLFYWFQIRPAKIRSYCETSTQIDTQNKMVSIYDQLSNYADYQSCLSSKGLQK